MWSAIGNAYRNQRLHHDAIVAYERVIQTPDASNETVRSAEVALAQLYEVIDPGKAARYHEKVLQDENVCALP